MHFSVLYSVTCPVAEPIGQFLPTQRQLFETLAYDGLYQPGPCTRPRRRCKHRQLGGILDKHQLDRFVADTGLHIVTSELRVPNADPYHDGGEVAAAFLFVGYDKASKSALITPLHDRPCRRPMSRSRALRYWTMIHAALAHRYP